MYYYNLLLSFRMSFKSKQETVLASFGKSMVWLDLIGCLWMRVTQNLTATTVVLKMFNPVQDNLLICILPLPLIQIHTVTEIMQYGFISAVRR